MKILTYLTNNLYFQQKKLEGFAIFLLFLIITFQFDDFKLTWLWVNNKPVAITMGITTVITGLLWIKYQRKLKVQNFNKTR
jgi:hypothetical protein